MNASITAIPSGSCRANEPNSEVPLAEDMPTPGKHQLKPTPFQIAQHRIERLAKKLEQLQSEVAAVKQAAETQLAERDRKITALEEKLASSQGQIATLEGQIAELQNRLEKLASATPARKAEEAPPKAIPVPTIEGHDGPVHVVKKGENLISIARRYGTTAAAIMEKNQIKDERRLQIGQALAIPVEKKDGEKKE